MRRTVQGKAKKTVQEAKKTVQGTIGSAKKTVGGQARKTAKEVKRAPQSARKTVRYLVICVDSYLCNALQH